MASIGYVPEQPPDVWHVGRTLAARCWRRFATALAGALLAALAAGDAAGQTDGLLREVAPAGGRRGPRPARPFPIPSPCGGASSPSTSGSSRRRQTPPPRSPGGRKPCRRGG